MICSTWGCFLHLQANLMNASDFCGRNMPLSRTMQGSFPSKQTMLRQEAVYSVYCFRRREKTWCSETRECSSWKTDVTVLEIASCGSPFKNLFEAAATTFVNGTALQAGVAGLEWGLCWIAVAAPVTAPAQLASQLRSHMETGLPLDRSLA